MVAVSETNVKLWLANGAVLGEPHIDSLSQFVKDYPFYAPTQAVLAKALYNVNDERFEEQLQKAALCNSDRQWLYNYIHQPLLVNESRVSPSGSSTVNNSSELSKVPNEVNVLIQAKTELVDHTTTIDDTSQKENKPNPSILDSEDSQELDNANVEGLLRVDEESTKEHLKINITPGDGEVLTGVEEMVSEAAVPRLHVEDENPATGVKEVKTKKVSNKKKTKTKERHSFLDWLDYTTYNRKRKEAVPIAKIEKSVDLLVQPKLDVNEVKGSISKTAELLEKFIANKPKPGEVKLEIYSPEEKSVASDSPSYIPFSETLAEVYVGQNEIEMAIEIYEKLKLKFPEKSTYFADLIQKLNI